MAALLRSARALNLSASPLLQIKRTSNHRQTISRFYSRTVGGRGIGVCSRQIISGSFNVKSLSPCSSAWPCSGTRYYGTPAEQKVVARDEPSLGVRNKQSHQFDWALAKLDSSVRRTGRVTKSLLQRIFHDICRTGYPSGNQALLLLRSCGSLLPELPLAERTEFAHHIWGKLLELGAAYDVSHYNALLKVYLQNEFKFSPTEFLAKMEAANVQPNRVTYQRLIAAYCQVGDIEGASKVLGFMKSKDLPITEAVFNSLVTGHSRAGDMESAVNILSVMRGTGIDPGPDTYLALLVAYAEKGDMDKIKETLNQVENTDISLMDRDLMQVVFTLTVAGHQQHVPEVLEHLRHDGGFVPDAMNLCLSLITQGHESTAFMLLKTFPSVQADSQNSNGPDVGNFFLRHCVNTNKSPEELVGFCKGLMDSNLHAAPMQFTLYCALEAKKMAPAIEVMKTMKEEGLPIRPHYFWPLLAQHKRDQNTAGTLEVLKAMQELSTEPDIDTYCNYVLRTFPSVDSARTALADAGIAVDTIAFVSAEVRAEAAEGNLARLFAFLSSPSLPAIDIGVFRGNLIAGFKRSSDVENMVNLTELLYKDTRLSQTSTGTGENMAYFLYHLFDGMSETEVQAKEEVLREYLQQLHKKGICIPVNIYRGIRNILDSHHVPELIKDVLTLVYNKEVESISTISSGLESRVTLERKLEELKAQGSSGDSAGAALIFKRLISAVCAEENLPRALELKAEHEDKMSPSCYALLINLCCRHDNPEEALNLKRELARMDSEATLDVNKYMSLLRVLSKHNRLEEAVDILKEMKEKDVVVKDTAVVLLFHTFSAVALRGDVAALRRLQDTTFALGLAKPTSNLCSPMVTMYLEKGDFAGALEAVMECETQYHQLPRIHDVLCGIVKKGDTELLQKAMDFVSQQRGEMTVLYDLFFAFLQTGRYREARKIIETPGLRAKPGRLQWYAEKCIGSNQMEALETMVDLTAKLFECDRDEMYHYLLCLCKDTNDWSKAEAVWTKMQEENVIPRERTLRLLADIFKTNNQEVPFEVPEMWYEQHEAKEHHEAVNGERAAFRASSLKEASPSRYQLRVMALCKKRKVQEAYNVLKEAERLGKALVPACYDALIKALLSSGSMEDAMAVKDIAANHITGFQLSDMAHNLQIITQVKQERPQDALASLKTMLQMDQVPSQLALTRLVQGLGNHGDIKGIQEVASLIKSLSPSLNMSSMLFVNNMALAHIKNGDLERALEDLESLYTQTADHSQQSIAFVFRKVVEAHNDEAFDKLRTMAERLCHQFASYKPATDLFLQCLDTGRVEEARQLLQRCAAVAEQKTALVSYMAKASQSPGQIAKIKNLLELIPDFAEKELVYAYMMKCHAMDKNLEAAKALYRRMQAEGLQMNELSLKRLAQLYKKAGEPVPFEEPPETFKFYADKLKASTLPSPEDD
ncbi:leucine-rich PPR motif-containing protein, mitochondrial [Electrophorus electricus]|uniref:PROP1-like PPR domain-containing protein n=1 Tax=Electrophorus electricus TaxID=8005 RepID=A0A4W4ETS9_ELEEL|nr:leucine-rich PPR motif-containing protein, mitochondrial [Electrophorus electricus]